MKQFLLLLSLTTYSFLLSTGPALAQTASSSATLFIPELGHSITTPAPESTPQPTYPPPPLRPIPTPPTTSPVLGTNHARPNLNIDLTTVSQALRIATLIPLLFIL